MMESSVSRTLSIVPIGWRWLIFFAAVLLAWGALFVMSANVNVAAQDGVQAFGADYLLSLCANAARDASYPALFAMWALMSAAMMAPTAVPAFKTFDDLTYAGAANGQSFATLVGGYLFVWIVFAAFGAGAQVLLSGADLLDFEGRSINAGLNAALLFIAGGYQFTRFKEACLSQCRRPLVFFLGHWRDGRAGAFRMGGQLGLVCVGCCWALMLLAFVGGTMSLAWMGLATVFMTLEKLPEIGRVLTRPLGVLLIAGGAWMALAATRMI